MANRLGIMWLNRVSQFSGPASTWNFAGPPTRPSFFFWRPCMAFSILRTMRALIFPLRHLNCRRSLWLPPPLPDDYEAQAPAASSLADFTVNFLLQVRRRGHAEEVYDITVPRLLLPTAYNLNALAGAATRKKCTTSQFPACSAAAPAAGTSALELLHHRPAPASPAAVAPTALGPPLLLARDPSW